MNGFDRLTMNGQDSMIPLILSLSKDEHIFKVFPGRDTSLGLAIANILSEISTAHIIYLIVDPEGDLFALMFTRVVNAEPTGQHRGMRADFDRLVYQALV